MLLGKHYLFLFPSKTHKKFPSQVDKIGWFPSQLIKFIFQPEIPRAFKSLDPKRPNKSEMLEKVSNSQAKPLSITKFPSQLIETPVFLPASKRNGFVGCPCKFTILNRTMQISPPNSNRIQIDAVSLFT